MILKEINIEKTTSNEYPFCIESIKILIVFYLTI